MKPNAAAKPKKPRKLSDVQVITIRFVTGMEGCRNPATWGRELKIAKNLITKYGREFMLWLKPIEGYQVNSMMWFHSDLGKNYLSDQLLEYEKQKISPTEKPEIVTAEAKIGEDIQTEFKPKTLRDFLYGRN